MPASYKPIEWESGQSEGRTINVHCHSWRGFFFFINSHVLNLPSAIFRGQAMSSWPLLSSLDRVLSTHDFRDRSLVDSAKLELRRKHLENFKYASRGRRSSGAPVPLDDDEWWALGQHYGLKTPLLDWTESPFVAAFFAFWEEGFEENQNAAIYVLSRQLVQRKVSDLRIEASGNGDIFTGELRFIRPLADDNARLVNQRGLFSLSPENECVRSWVAANFKEEDTAPLVCVTIPRTEREIALRSLNRMNINALTLFPDLSGSSSFCNTRLRDRFY